jgi:hypothetical protein
MSFDATIQQWIIETLGYDDQHVILNQESGRRPSGDFAAFKQIASTDADYFHTDKESINENLIVTISTSTGSGSFARSIDGGSSWTVVPGTGATAWGSAVFGGGVFNILPKDGDTATARSTDDGLTWASVTIPEGNTWQSAIYIYDNPNQVIVAVSTDGVNRIMRSTDLGLSWTPIAAPEANTWRSVAYGDGVFIAVSTDGVNRAIRSDDLGLTWQPLTNTPFRVFSSIVYGENAFVVIALDGTDKILRSETRGITWQEIADTDYSLFSPLEYSGVDFYTPGFDVIVRSYNDGLSWTSVPDAGTDSWYLVVPGNDDNIEITYTSPEKLVYSVSIFAEDGALRLANLFKSRAILASRSILANGGLALWHKSNTRQPPTLGDTSWREHFQADFTFATYHQLSEENQRILNLELHGDWSNLPVTITR